MWITAALAAVQMISSLTANSQKQAAKREAISGVGRPTGASVEAVQRARIQAGTTVAPGAAQEAEAGRQAAADVVGAATRTAADSSKVSAAVTRAGISQTRGAQAIAARGERYQERAEGRLAQSLAGLSVEERRSKEARDKIYMEAETAKANLLGAGVSNILTMERDRRMMDFYKELNPTAA